MIASAFSGQVAADVNGYAVKPAVKILRRVEPAEGFVNAQERFLRGVARVFPVAQQRHASEMTRVGDYDNLIEGRRVAGFRADY